MKKIILTLAILLTVFSSIIATPFFSGFAGGKFQYTSSTDIDEEGNSVYDPSLQLQAFFAGQFNFTQNLWARMEISFNTEDLINQSLFTTTNTQFQIDELSLTIRNQNPNCSNYLSTFMGTFDPIGSDIFLQRYFSIEPIASELTNSWLGLAGSILYPHFGIGVSDTVRLFSQPIALGGSIYVNHSDTNAIKKYYVLNMDLRTACNYRFFTCDFAAGLGAPLSDKSDGEDVVFAIKKLLWHCGTTLLVGNNYTQSLFLQAGIFNAEFGKDKDGKIGINSDPNNIYLMFEPRFIIKKSHLNITAFSLPKDTVEDLLYIDDTFGLNINLYTEALQMNGTPFKLGCHTSLSFTDKNIVNFFEDTSVIKDYFMPETRCFNVNVIPYFSTHFLNGELNSLFKIQCMKFVNSVWYEAFSADIGYKVKL